MRIAYYTQLTEPIKEDRRVIAYLRSGRRSEAKDSTSISVAELLERFLFPRHTHGSLIDKLSGGNAGVYSC